ncbi:MAG: translational GTPase TypA, partial [Lachnospiraceae bacterium]|nr:translational GTPase TypA [Lachnospiraceae bacterium]
DAYEGAMPQTRFVLKKALELDLKPIVVVNKIDKRDARPSEVIDEIIDLFIDLNASEDQLEFPVIYASSRDGIAMYDLDDDNCDLKPLFDTIVKYVPAPDGDKDEPFQMLISNIYYYEYVGKIAVGKVKRGTIKDTHQVVICKKDGKTVNSKIGKLYIYNGLNKTDVSEVEAGEIVCISGLSDFNIGETLCSQDKIDPLPIIEVDEPTISMNFLVNNSPFAGREGDFVTSRHLRDRLFKEVETNVSLRVEETDSADCASSCLKAVPFPFPFWQCIR